MSGCSCILVEAWCKASRFPSSANFLLANCQVYMFIIVVQECQKYWGSFWENIAEVMFWQIMLFYRDTFVSTKVVMGEWDGKEVWQTVYYQSCWAVFKARVCPHLGWGILLASKASAMAFPRPAGKPLGHGECSIYSHALFIVNTCQVCFSSTSQWKLIPTFSRLLQPRTDEVW